MTQAGWYPDPSGDYEVRWFDGSSWSAAVANAGYQMEDPLADPVLPPAEQVLWTQGPNQLSTHRVWVNDGVTRDNVEEIPLWAVAGVEVRSKTGTVGDVAIVVAYPGYGGRAHWVMSKVDNPHWVGAVARKWANRNRRATFGGAGA